MVVRLVMERVCWWVSVCLVWMSEGCVGGWVEGWISMDVDGHAVICTASESHARRDKVSDVSNPSTRRISRNPETVQGFGFRFIRESTDGPWIRHSCCDLVISLHCSLDLMDN